MTYTGLWNSTCQFINAMLFISLSAFAFEQIQDENPLLHKPSTASHSCFCGSLHRLTASQQLLWSFF